MAWLPKNRNQTHQNKPKKKHNNTTHKWQIHFSLKSKPDSFPTPGTSFRAQYTLTHVATSRPSGKNALKEAILIS